MNKTQVIDNKLFETIKSLSVVEKRACSVFLKSPYHNRRDDVWQLWKSYSTPHSPQIEFAEKVSRQTQSLLLGCIEAFLSQRAYEHAPLLSDLHLAPIYRSKSLRKSLDHVLRRASEHLEAMPRDHQYYHLQYQLEWERYAAIESQGRTRENNLDAVARAFDVYAIAGKLRLACLVESHRAVFQADYDDTFLPVLLSFLEGSELRTVPAVALYFYCYKSLKGDKEDDFRAFRREMENQSQSLPSDESRIFLLLAINFCIRRLNSGEQGYVREAFDFYKLGLENSALLENNRLSRFAFKNIVSLGLKLDEHQWVEAFIQQYEPLLEEKHRAAHRDYNLAKVYFARKDYRSAMPLLARVDESDLLLNLDSRIMLLKMYYETGEWDALDALLSSFKILLLRKKKVIGYHQQHYLNTLRYIQKLIRLQPGDPAAAGKLRADLEKNKAIIEREWLIEKIGRAGAQG